MKPLIQFIGAGAGSGKTTAVVNTIVAGLLDGSCAPAGLIATTYTVKAAQELRERIRRALLEGGHAALARQLDLALIGTVHSVCARVLRRFAFEAGISPAVEVLAEEEGARLRSQAVDAASSPEDIRELQRVALRLGQLEARTREFWYPGQLRKLLDEIRSNDFAAEQLPAMAVHAAEEFLSLFPCASTENLDQRLQHAIETVVPALERSGNTKKNTADYVEALRRAQKQLAKADLSWLDWVRLAKSAPADKVAALATPVTDVLGRLGEHPRLHADIHDYTRRLFQLAQGTLRCFQELKQKQGVLDFADLEHLSLRLLRENDTARAACREGWQLVVVDEFQDTSPLQLALFMEWAKLARRSVWVGDVKQAIYGFRNTDPRLTDAVVAGLRKVGAADEILGVSYRSVPDLVTLVNELFQKPFADSIGLRPKDVTLTADRKSFPGGAPALEFFDLRSGVAKKDGKGELKLKLNDLAACVADGIRKLLDPKSGRAVFDRQLGQPRPVAPGDIAVLCRKNQHARNMATALSAAGFTVSLGGAGLLATPEGCLALACLRRVADKDDSLAAAEVVVLGTCSEPEVWLAERLQFLAANPKGADRWRLDGPQADARLVRLEAVRAQSHWLSPTEALDLALAAGEVLATVTAWGPSSERAAQRRANVEALRGMAGRYEDHCRSGRDPATVAGFLNWCAIQQENGADAKASDPSPGAIQVLTYHGAKGLEWPVVLCTDLEEADPADLFDVQSVSPDAGKEVSFENPLAGRALRFWASPFGSNEAGIPLLDDLQQSRLAQERAAQSRAEALRLLYVGLTRARDLLVLVRLPGQELKWLDLLGTPALSTAVNEVTFASGQRIPCRTQTLLPTQVTRQASCAPLRWLATASSRTARVPATLSPSHAEPFLEITAAEPITYGSRLPVIGTVVEAALGDALHAILAAELLNPTKAGREAKVREQLAGFDLATSLDAAAVVAMMDSFRADLAQRFSPSRVLVETPFSFPLANGQRVSGVMDLLLETPKGWVLLDHKSYQGRRDQWAAKALTFSGQLALYAQALRESGMTVVEVWVHFPVGGGLVRLQAG